VIALALLLLAPHFPGGAGWHTGAAGAHTWASTVPLRDCANCIPHRTLAVLPPGGVVIQLTVATERRIHGAAVSWPTHVRRSEVVAGFEGVSARYGVVQQFTHTGRVEHILWVWFGRARPTRAQLAAVNAQLRGLR
jgi:hypothetical protein